ncbi:MAG: HAMP domain-containing protein [Planctomycetes bacterium]|nr:HAMP domain-containing protein [Planctomycetota bacterium]
MLGMALVAAILALLVAGTEKGLSSLRATMKTLECKVAEVKAATKLQAEVRTYMQLEAPQIADRLPTARIFLSEYKSKLEQTLATRHEPFLGFAENEFLPGLESKLDSLETALKPFLEPFTIRAEQEDSSVQKAVGEVVGSVDDLNGIIQTKMHERIKNSQNESAVSLWIVGGTCGVAIFLMIGMLRFFFVWVARPIRDLEQGVGLVAKGNFEHRIEIHSGDEIEDLANAFNDMTGRLNEIYGDLAQQVNERSRQLVRSERLAGVGFLAAGVAHEINNPLASIAFCSEALDRRLAELFESGRLGAAPSTPLLPSARALQMAANTSPPPPLSGAKMAEMAQEREIITKYLKMIQDEAFRCKEITQKLLAFSRGGERRREPTDVGELIQIVLDMVQHLPNHKGKELIFEPSESITAWLNGQEIKQVFLNLVVNALDSMEEGGKLVITQRIKSGLAELVFQDTGCGMSAEVLENIFEPFFTRSRTGKGTGLGLSISHRIINQHGGEIAATSAGPNQGSSFTVRLPLEAAADQQEGNAENLDPEVEFVKLQSARQGRKAA